MTDWQPGASTQTLQLRAKLLAAIRAFFAERGVLEVETPLLASFTVTDVNLASFPVNAPSLSTTRYLQTSPEYAMKRLLAAGSGPIYQICKAFRQEERSRMHNPEFTLLEWYRPGFAMHQLMDEVAQLLAVVLGVTDIPRYSYAEVFQRYLHIDPHSIEEAALQKLTRGQISLGEHTELDATDCLQLLMNHCIEPKLPEYCFIYDYPAAQAALAEIERNADGKQVARRFELYGGGMELANAYQELLDADIQRQRFESDRRVRAARGLPVNPVDEKLLAALEHGLPPCSGIALGLDRLVMLAAKETNISSVLAFDHERS